MRAILSASTRCYFLLFLGRSASLGQNRGRTRYPGGYERALSSTSIAAKTSAARPLSAHHASEVHKPCAQSGLPKWIQLVKSTCCGRCRVQPRLADEGVLWPQQQLQIGGHLLEL